MVKKADIPAHLVETALSLAAERGWRELSLSQIATAAKLPLSEVYPVYRSKRAILEGLSQLVDERVLAGQPAAWAEEDTPRDRLFDVLMRRFDALGPYKPERGVQRAAAHAFDDLDAGGRRDRQPRHRRLPACPGPGAAVAGDAQGLARRRQPGPGPDHGGPRCAPAPGRAMRHGHDRSRPRRSATGGGRRRLNERVVAPES
jgi:AcrR family transcriptional regulator